MTSGLHSSIEWMIRARWGQVPTTPADTAPGSAPTRAPRRRGLLKRLRNGDS
ncbi:hypothetical protein [Sphaerisporangium aureirubrum]|uniref:Uncharacterized protein n=1 Tax=Sphaerisporangium aureirubrum TaxID=1544736 RepID=A0ABW1NNE3_9ACTN